MTKRLLQALTATTVWGALLSACPGDENMPPAGQQNTAGAEAAVAKAIAKARASESAPKPPSLQKLCSLEFGRTDYEQAKKIFGKPDDESMDKSKAGLSFRYEDEKDGKPIAVTLVLTFDWSDGTPGTGTIIFGIGGDPEDFLTGYILSEASITGMTYPPCWPHEEP